MHDMTMNLRKVARVTGLLAVSAVLGISATSAVAAPSDGDGEGVQLVGIEVFDPTSVNWFDDRTGKAIDNPFPDYERTADSSASPDASTMTDPAGCNGINYRVLFHFIADDTLRSACYWGSGTYNVPSTEIAMMVEVVGVCPRAAGGQIRYNTWSGLHWSTYRAPSVSPDCFNFGDTGVYPDHYVTVSLP